MWRLLLVGASCASALVIRPPLGMGIRAQRIPAPIVACDVPDDGECVIIDPKDLPDCVDPATPGTFFACEEPPVGDSSITCFQPGEMPECDDGTGTAEGGTNKKWICMCAPKIEPGPDPPCFSHPGRPLHSHLGSDRSAYSENSDGDDGY